MNQRGLVLEVKEEYAVVLTPKGEFCRIPRTVQMQVGQEVTFPVLSTLQAQDSKVVDARRGANRFTGRNRKWWSFGATAAVLLVAAGTWLGTGLTHPGTAQAYAWVSVDLNPSISLEVDNHLKVEIAHGTDMDGQQLLTAVKVKGMTLSEATEAIVDYAASHNMIAENGAILLSVSPIASGVDTSKVQAVAEQGALQAVKTSKVKLNTPPVYTVSVPKTIWRAAQNANVSPGRLVSVLVSAEEGTPTGLSQAEGATLRKVWSNPAAKKAMNTLSKTDDTGLAAALQSLAAAGYIGQGTVSEPNNSQTNLVSNDTDSQSGNEGSESNASSNGHGNKDGGGSQPPLTAIYPKGNHGQSTSASSPGRGNGASALGNQIRNQIGNQVGNQVGNQIGTRLGNLIGNETQNFGGLNSTVRRSGNQTTANNVTIHVGNQSFTIPWQLPDGFKTPGKESSTSDDGNPHPAQQSGKRQLGAQRKPSSSNPPSTTSVGAADRRDHDTNSQTSGKWGVSGNKSNDDGHGWQGDSHGH